MADALYTLIFVSPPTAEGVEHTATQLTIDFSTKGTEVLGPDGGLVTFWLESIRAF